MSRRPWERGAEPAAKEPATTWPGNLRAEENSGEGVEEEARPQLPEKVVAALGEG
jgi:hypothetical protein